MRPRIYVAYTGGTIGMTATEHGFAPEPGWLRGPIEALIEASRDEPPHVEFDEFDPIIDSSNATPRTWSRIASALWDRRDDFDGFVVLHGTDTMAYTASALSFLLPGFGKPVVITGSQVPMSVEGSDGQQNLIRALGVAGGDAIHEVSLLFGSKLLRGNRATKVDAAGFDAFDSPSFPPLGRLNPSIRYDTRIAPPAPQGPRLLRCGLAHVAAVRLFPGFEARVIESLCRPPLEGLVIEAYGAGNGPSSDAAFLGAIEAATAAGIVVVVVTQCLRGSVAPGAYASGSAMILAGAVPGFDMTSEAALTKLAVLLGEGIPSSTVAEMMQADLAGELTHLG
ncbi:MAG: asparaginase [Coriobacteriia bacterium]|nr:asparaginase [Coriobacteriia bacterium]